MTVRELIEKLSQCPPELPVLVGSTPGHDYYEVELVVPHEGTDEDYVLVAGPFEDEADR